MEKVTVMFEQCSRCPSCRVFVKAKPISNEMHTIILIYCSYQEMSTTILLLRFIYIFPICARCIDFFFLQNIRVYYFVLLLLHNDTSKGKLTFSITWLHRLFGSVSENPHVFRNVEHEVRRLDPPN